MINFLLTTIIPDLAYIIITFVFGVLSYYTKRFLEKHKGFIEEQENALKTQIGVNQYNMDKSIAESIVLRIEEEAKNFDWDSEIKHSKATELISKKTGLDAETIYSIIKATVTKIKMGQANVTESKPIEQTVINNTTIQSDKPVDTTVKQDATPEQTQTVGTDAKQVPQPVVNNVDTTNVNNTNSTPAQNSTQTQAQQ